MPVEYTCPYCHKPVIPAAPNATRSATTNQWQHKNCETEDRDQPA